MPRIYCLPVALSLVLAGSVATAQPPAAPAGQAQAAAPAVKRTESGKGLVIPEDQARLGTLYQTTPAGGKQVTFTSEALHAKFDGHSAGVIGYAIAGPAESPGALKAGMWAMPVKSLQTGNKLKDKHLADDIWLDAAKFPDITFTLKEVRDLKPHKETATGKSFTCTLVGDMTLHGVTRALSIPDTILGFAGAGDKTPLKGDLLAIRCKYTIKLSEFGIRNEYTTTLQSVSDEIGIDQSLMLSTVPPEQQPEVKSEAEPKTEGK
jgi:polyisoprenoid-binding protein YceI